MGAEQARPLQLGIGLAPHQRVKGHTVWPEKDFPRTHTLKPKRDEIMRLLAAQEAPGIRSGV